MTNLMKKLSALVLALALLLTVCAGAMAANVYEAIDHTDIPKTIDLNGTLASVYSPNVEYTFTLAPVDPAANATITDEANVVSVVTKGVENGATLANDGKVTFTTAETSVTNDITENLTVNFDATKFSKPGVYRYELKDVTEKATLDAAGITRPATYTDTYYLDVYVRNNDNLDGFEVYGTILSKGNDSKTISATDKQQQIDPDSYYTVDVTVTKVVTGAMGDVNHEFPFTITLANNTLSYHANENAAPTVDDDASDTVISVNLKNNDVYYLYGLSPLATIIHQELNDTVDTYTLTVTGADGSTILASTSIALNETKNTGNAHVLSNYEDSATATVTVDPAFKAVTFTNNLDEISPTGVVLRVAPYILILGAGLALLVLSHKRRHTAA